MSAEAIHMFGENETAAHVTTITHCAQFVRVAIAEALGDELVLSRAVRQRQGVKDSWTYAAQLARTIEDAAAAVDASALILWLQDCGFSVSN